MGDTLVRSKSICPQRKRSPRRSAVRILMHVCQAGGRVSSLEDGGSLETPKTDHVPGPVCTPLVSLLTPPLLSRDLLIRNAQSDSRSAHTAPDGDASPSSASPLGLVCIRRPSYPTTNAPHNNAPRPTNAPHLSPPDTSRGRTRSHPQYWRPRPPRQGCRGCRRSSSHLPSEPRMAVGVPAKPIGERTLRRGASWDHRFAAMRMSQPMAV